MGASVVVPNEQDPKKPPTPGAVPSTYSPDNPFAGKYSADNPFATGARHGYSPDNPYAPAATDTAPTVIPAGDSAAPTKPGITSVLDTAPANVPQSVVDAAAKMGGVSSVSYDQPDAQGRRAIVGVGRVQPLGVPQETLERARSGELGLKPAAQATLAIAHTPEPIANSVLAGSNQRIADAQVLGHPAGDQEQSDLRTGERLTSGASMPAPIGPVARAANGTVATLPDSYAEQLARAGAPTEIVQAAQRTENILGPRLAQRLSQYDKYGAPATQSSNVGRRAVGAVVQMAEHPVDAAVGMAGAPVESVATLIDWANQRDGVRPINAGPDYQPVTNRDAVIAAGQLLTIPASEGAAGAMERVFGEAAAKRAAAVYAATGSPGRALAAAQVGRVVVRGASGAAIGAAYDPSDPAVGATLGGVAGAVPSLLSARAFAQSVKGMAISEFPDAYTAAQNGGTPPTKIPPAPFTHSMADFADAFQRKANREPAPFAKNADAAADRATRTRDYARNADLGQHVASVTPDGVLLDRRGRPMPMSEPMIVRTQINTLTAQMHDATDPMEQGELAARIRVLNLRLENLGAAPRAETATGDSRGASEVDNIKAPGGTHGATPTASTESGEGTEGTRGGQRRAVVGPVAAGPEPVPGREQPVDRSDGIGRGRGAVDAPTGVAGAGVGSDAATDAATVAGVGGAAGASGSAASGSTGGAPLGPQRTTPAPRPQAPERLAPLLANDGPVGQEAPVHYSDGTRHTARYRVVEASDLEPSHNPQTFQPNPESPAQGRAYEGSAGKAAREHVMAGAEMLQAHVLLDRTGGLTEGPPLVTGDRRVIAGHGRAMMMMRAATANTSGYQAYRAELEARANDFGVDAAHVQAMQHPVLVRELTEPSVDQHDVTQLRAINQRSDEAPTKTKDEVSQAMSLARQMPHAEEALRHMEETMDPESTLNAYLGTDDGARFVQLLSKEGVIPREHLPAYMDAASGKVHQQGRIALQNALLASVIDDATLLTRAPDNVLDKLTPAVPALLVAARVPKWPLTPFLQEAIDLHVRARAMQVDQKLTKRPSIAAVLSQHDVFGDAPEPTPLAMQLAELLEVGSKTLVAKRLRAYAHSAQLAQQDGETNLFGEVDTPEKAFARSAEAAKPKAEDGLGFGGVAEKGPEYRKGRAVDLHASADEHHVRLEGMGERQVYLPSDPGVSVALLKDENLRRMTELAARLAPHIPEMAADYDVLAHEYRRRFGTDPISLAGGGGDTPKGHSVMEDRAKYAAASPRGTPTNIAEFYSRLEDRIATGPAKATGAQWSARLADRTAKTERAWTGIDDALASRATDVLTRDEVQVLASKQRIALTEKVHDVTWDDDDMRTALDRAHRAHSAARVAIEDAASPALKTERNVWGNSARLGNAHEAAARGDVHAAIRILAEGNGGSISERHERNILRAFEQRRAAFRQAEFFEGREAKFNEYVQPGEHSHYREIVVHLDRPDDAHPFRSVHFDGKNPLLHIRLTDRTLPDGRRALFVEEVQSDWHQAGRRKGYEGGEPIEVDGKSLDEWKTIVSHLEESRTRDSGDDAPDGASILQRLTRARAAVNQIAQAQFGTAGRVPNAPLKKTDEWVGLALRRVLAEAVNGHYDAIALPTGEQVADALRMDGVIDRVMYDPDTHVLNAKGYANGGADIERVVQPDQLADYIGAAATRQLLESPLLPKHEALEHYTTFSHEPHEATGHAHVIDTSGIYTAPPGMRAFYDRMVPNTLRHELKSLGVKDAALTPTSGVIPAHPDTDTASNLVLPVTPELRDAIASRGLHVAEHSPDYSTSRAFDTPAIRTAQSRADAIPRTADIDTPERRAWRNLEAGELARQATRFDRRIDLVLGLPGSGKSSVAVAGLASENGASVLDADTVKEHAPEWNGGLGADALHAESVAVRVAAQRQLVARGANIVFPTVGDPINTVALAKAFQADGYTVNVHLIDVPNRVAAQRMLEGWQRGERHFVNPQRILDRGDDPRRAFAAIADLPGVIAHDPINNAGERSARFQTIPDWRERFGLSTDSRGHEAGRPANDARGGSGRTGAVDSGAQGVARGEGSDEAPPRSTDEAAVRNSDDTKATGLGDEPGPSRVEERRRIGSGEQPDMFGDAPMSSGADRQDSLFGTNAGTDAARSLADAERAARAEVAHLKQKIALTTNDAEKRTWAARIAQLEKLANRANKIGSDELTMRALADDAHASAHDDNGELFGGVGEKRPWYDMLGGAGAKTLLDLGGGAKLPLPMTLVQAREVIRSAVGVAFRSWDRMHDESPKPMPGEDMLRAFRAAAKQAAEAIFVINRDDFNRVVARALAPSVIEALAMRDAEALADYYTQGRRAGEASLKKAIAAMRVDQDEISHVATSRIGGDLAPYRESMWATFAEATQKMRGALLGEDEHGNPLPRDEELERQENLRRGALGRVEEARQVYQRLQLDLFNAARENPDGALAQHIDDTERRRAFGDLTSARRAMSPYALVLRAAERRGLQSGAERLRQLAEHGGRGRGGRQWVDMRGLDVSTAEKMAEAMRLVRDPKVERISVVLTDAADQVRSWTIETSGALGFVNLMSVAEATGTGVRGAAFVERIIERAQRMGLRRVWLGHNHPSGDATASPAADVPTTSFVARELAKHGIELVGHVVIDHDTYSMIHVEDGPSGRVHVYNNLDMASGTSPAYATSEELYAPVFDHPEKVAEALAGVAHPDVVTIAHTDSQRRAIAVVPMRNIKIDTIHEWLPAQMKGFGSDAVTIIAPLAVAHAIVKAANAAFAASPMAPEPGMILPRKIPTWGNDVTDIFPVHQNGRIEPDESFRAQKLLVIPEYSFRSADAPARISATRTLNAHGTRAQTLDHPAERDSERDVSEGRDRTSATHDDRRPATAVSRDALPTDGDADGLRVAEAQLPYASGLPAPTGGLPDATSIRKFTDNVKALVNPELLGDGAKGTAGTLRHQGALSFRALARANYELRDFMRALDKLSDREQAGLWDRAEHGVPTGNTALDEANQELDAITDRFTQELIGLDRLKADAVRAHYIGRFWTQDPDAPIDFLIRAKSRRPVEGPKSFLKPRTWESFADGLEAIQHAKDRLEADRYTSDAKGDAARAADERLAQMRPATYNYVRSQLAKIAEMQRVIAAEKMLRAERASGRARPILNSGEPPTTPDGRRWVKIDPDGNDPAFILYGAPEVTHFESVDSVVWGQLHRLIQDLRATHVRKAKIGGGGRNGGIRLGYARPGEIVTKFGTDVGVLMHELGHILDFAFGLGDKITAAIGEAPKRTAQSGKHVGKQVPDYSRKGGDTAEARVQRKTLRDEWRQLANLRRQTTPGVVPDAKNFEPSDRRYLHKRTEKTANVIEAYLRTPDLFKQVAPGIYGIVDRLIADNPALHPLRDIKPSLAHEQNAITTRLPGPTVNGHWYAHPDAAAVWRAHLSRGVRGSAFRPLYDALQFPAHAAAQILLGFSGFHLMTIAREGVNSSIAQAIQHATTFDRRGVAPAARALGRAPVAAATDVAFGRKIMQEYRAPGTHPELARVLDAMMRGGFRGTQASEFWTGERWEALKQHWRDAVRADSAKRRVKSATAIPTDVIFGTIEQAMKPIMGEYVPLMKTAATYRAVADALAKLDPATTDMNEVHRVMGDIVKQMDYRYGQVVYDNHFMNRVVKDLAQLVFLAPGWTFGTMTLLGRGAKQLGSASIEGPRRLASGARHLLGAGGGGRKLPPSGGAGASGDQSSGSNGANGSTAPSGASALGPVPPSLIGPDAAYWIGGVALFMLVNAILTYLHTGEQPHDKDYFAYRDGSHDEFGNPNRNVLPGYEMHDVYSWKSHPLTTLENKLSPALAFAARAWNNADYYGNMLYDPHAPATEKARELASAAGHELGTPITVQNMSEAKTRNEGGWAEYVRSALGISPAKREFVRTPAQNLLSDFLRAKGHDALTPEEAAQAETRREIKRNVLAGTISKDSLRSLVHNRTLTLGQAVNDVRATRVPLLVSMFKQLSADEALQVWAQADDAEKALWRKPLRQKLLRARRRADIPDDARDDARGPAPAIVGTTP